MLTRAVHNCKQNSCIALLHLKNTLQYLTSMKCITMETELNASIKADLISIGSVQVDKSLFPDQFKSTATAGPGAGGSSIFLKAGNRRVRLTINDLSPLRLMPEDEHVVVVKGDDVIARGVLEHPLCHCPEQAYITLSEKCIYDCQFCPVPKLQGEIKTSEKVHQMVAEAYATGELKAISLDQRCSCFAGERSQKGSRYHKAAYT